MLDPRSGHRRARSTSASRNGEIAEIGSDLQIDGEVIDGTGRHLFPGFVDPHVHLRVPGQEHKEDLETGTRSAAAGGFVAVVAMPNTSPTVDSAPILRSLREAGPPRRAHPRRLPGQRHRRPAGESLTEMAELRECGALGFTDDGKPVHRAGILRKALQYQKLVRRDHRAARGGPDALRQGRHARGRGLARGSASPASRASPSPR